MTAADLGSAVGLLPSRPQVRPDLVIGPALVKGAGIVHHIKDPRTGWYFRVGSREVYLISRLDGDRTLTEIGDEYAGEFGRRLNEAAWQQLLGMLVSRRLLVGTDDDVEMAQIAADAKRRSRSGRTLLRARLPLVEPDHLLSRILPALRPMFSPWMVVPVLLAIVTVEAAVLLNVRSLVAEAAGMWESPPLAAAVLLLAWANLAAHELAHGLTCRLHGGRVPEIGVMWRFPLVFPYCKADDVMLFPARRHRVDTAFAGVYTSLLLLLPFAAAYPVLGPGPVRAAVAGILLYGSAAALLNLVPFFQLDGYFMVAHGLGMVDLREESYRFLGRIAQRALQRPVPPVNYPRRSRWIYAVYGTTSILFGLTVAVAIVGWWVVQLFDHTEPSLTTVLLMTGSAAAGSAVYAWRRRRRLAAKPAASPFVTSGEVR